MALHDDALTKAKVALMGKPDSVFFTTVLFSLRQRFTQEIPTAATNGKEILINPDFFMKHDKDEQVFLLIHEAMHVAYLHMDRAMWRERRKFNVAADYVINLQLVERGFKMPPSGLLDRQYAGMSAEQVYDLLPANPPPPPMEDLIPGDGDPAASAALEAEVQDILVRAALQSKMAGDKPGSIPGDVEIYLDRILNPKLSPQAILRKYMQKYAKNDYSMKRPNRRFFPEHHLPSLYSPAIIDLVAAVDASISVSDDDFKQQVSEVANILRQTKPDKLTLLPFDVKLRKEISIRNINELLQVKFTGRGGTKIAPVIQYAIDKKPQVMLVFSDGEFNFPDLRPKHTDFIWLIYNNPGFTAPFGKVIHYEMHHGYSNYKS